MFKTAMKAALGWKFGCFLFDMAMMAIAMATDDKKEEN